MFNQCSMVNVHVSHQVFKANIPELGVGYIHP